MAFGTHEVLRGVSFALSERERVGLVGPNGEGKTTLLRIVSGEYEPTLGAVSRAGTVRIGYLPQDPPALPGSCLYDAMLDMFSDLHAIENRLHTLADELACDHSEKTHAAMLEEYGSLQHQFEARGGYDITQRIESVLTGLSFPQEMWRQSLATLSGGQRTRAYLATLLLKSPDLLMLDEPTNHLDIEAVEWLEGWLKDYRGALLVVSHDRYFLDAVTTATWEVAAGALECYRGNYSAYVPKREQRLHDRWGQWQAQQDFISRERDFIAKHIAGQRSKEAQGRRTRLERYIRDESIPQPPKQRSMHLKLEATKRSGEIVLTTEDLSVGYSQDNPLAGVERLELIRGQKVAIVGPNGVGKTTLLRTLLGQIDALAGTFRLGSNVQVGYLSQPHNELDEEDTPLYAVSQGGRACLPKQALDALGAVQLGGDTATKVISQLSGGQRSRVILAKLAVLGANLLMLDEPTNHLDIASTEILQQAISTFEGTSLFVSHDRYLIQSVATDIWVVADGTIKALPGGWSQYLAWRAAHASPKAKPAASEVAAAPAATKSNAEAAPQNKTKRKENYRQNRQEANRLQKLRRDHNRIEKKIHTLEEELEGLNAEISAASQAGDLTKVEQLSRDFAWTDAECKELWAQWEKIGEQLEA